MVGLSCLFGFGVGLGLGVAMVARSFVREVQRLELELDDARREAIAAHVDRFNRTRVVRVVGLPD